MADEQREPLTTGEEVMEEVGLSEDGEGDMTHEGEESIEDENVLEDQVPSDEEDPGAYSDSGGVTGKQRPAAPTNETTIKTDEN